MATARTTLLVGRTKANAAIKKLIKRGNDLVKTSVRAESGFRRLVENYATWDEHNVSALRDMFSDDRPASDYESAGKPLKRTYSEWREVYADMLEGIGAKLDALESLRERLPLIAEEVAESTTSKARAKPAKRGGRGNVFLVIGRDDVWHSVERIIRKLGLDVTVLEEKPSRSRTIIEKFEHESANCAYAVVILSGDDEGRLRGSSAALTPRARQNVIFELGYFIAKLGRANVTAMLPPDVEKPSDIDGVMYVSMADRGWQLELGREIRDAIPGVSLDGL